MNFDNLMHYDFMTELYRFILFILILLLLTLTVITLSNKMREGI